MILNLVSTGNYFDDINQIHGFGIRFEPLFILIFYFLYSLRISSYRLIQPKFLAVFYFLLEFTKEK